MSFEDDYIVDPGAQKMAHGYATAERVLGVPAEMVALAINREGLGPDRHEAPGITDIHEVVRTVLDTHAVPPMGRMLSVLVDRGEGVSA